ncbi:MAG: transporter [Candidatus Rokubacteria bacterium RIFCSPLOWO2_02_FULL_73_56]|nr:MAG: transporter [Candidatus Rokubacteria bacterium RIFCSPHIGHO2_02_FULL_73_26]OGL10319.1 MAG: transporter [Candidatus Rokubacteria bacterium RIFCSPLOWO2_02_FULL_73_56]OGL29280.1 MAG: transporter [Candidatus Rokubacteria bacterium RIFCSPLOWO2_12_FULL_73_47]
MEILSLLAHGFAIALTPTNLTYCFLGSFIGTAIGVLPGLGPPATIALLLPITYGIPPTSAVILLAGIFYGAMYGGSTTSILLNIPGEAASVVTCLDGYQMARQGRAGAALAVSAVGSFIAGTVSVVGLMLLAPPLAAFALRFGAPEYFALLVLGLMMVGYLGGGSMTKGLMMAVLGLLLGMVGLDPIMGSPRFTYGVFKLAEGFEFVLVAMGLFGIGEVLVNVERRVAPEVLKTQIRGLLASREEWRAASLPLARGSLLGFFVGVLPGGGAIISSFVAYAVEKKLSRHPERFGRGAIEGVAGPESANNAAATSSFVPLLTLGIPGNASIALIFAALLIHGIRPGPLLVSEQPAVFWGLIASMYIGNVMLLILNFPLIRLWVRLLEVPYRILAPLIVVFVLVGAYSVNNSVFDVGTTVVFGALGYALRKLDFEPAPLVLAMILGPQLEAALRRSLIYSHGDLLVFFQRPIAATLMALAVLVLLSPVLRWGLERKLRELVEPVAPRD